ncbi:hypothetical protein Rsub_00419 [Raphidocelis subcapitata]|uniref:Uncharacterized protein n=1 Tax=Raphidocelis subcapitata TaxID=307507 RepID=A0A2V0NK97_9CHLO|nr:hypothetical protein Rsub_00419 [Raphidocelis subcapitata]|eukprot:GBF87708.1 hypothetical protein Rsub_00419 [Raphidocelis subcapitata]
MGTSKAASATDAEASVQESALRLAFMSLPAGEQCFAVSRISRDWAAWAAPRADALAARAAAAEAGGGPVAALACWSLPLWLLQEAWPQLTPAQRLRAAARAAALGDAESLSWALAAARPDDDGELARGPLICAAAAAGGHLEALKAARAAGCAWTDDVTTNAARGSHALLLHWALDNGCPADAAACCSALAPQLLQQDDSDALGSAAASVSALYAHHNQAVPAIARADGVMPALVSALHSADRRIVFAALDALSSFAEFGPAEAALIAAEPGALPAFEVAARLGGGFAFVCSITLGCIAGVDEAASLAVADARLRDATRDLAAAVAAGDDCWIFREATSIYQITQFSPHRVAAEEGAVAALMAALGTSDDRTAYHVAVALNGVAQACPEQVACVPGIWEGLVKTLTRGVALAGGSVEDPESSWIAAAAAISLTRMAESSHASASRLASTPGAVAALAAALATACRVAEAAPRPVGNEVDGHEFWARWSQAGSAAAVALFHLSRIPGDHVRGAAAAPVVGALVAALRSHSLHTSHNAAHALAHFAKLDSDLAQRAIAAGALPGLIGMLLWPCSTCVAACAMGALLDRAGEAAVDHLTALPDALPVIVAALASGPSPQEQPGEPAERVRSTASILQKLACGSAQAAWAVAYTPGALPALAAALTHPIEAAVEPAAGAIRGVASAGPQLAECVRDTPWAVEALSSVANNAGRTDNARAHASAALALLGLPRQA